MPDKTAIRTTRAYGAADVRAASFNADDRTVEIIWAAGAAVPRYNFDEGRFVEMLSMDPAHIRLDRFKAGMSLLDTHESHSMSKRLGSVLPDSVRIEGGKAYATVKLSRKPQAEELYQDLKDGHSFPVSVGYRVYAYEKREGGADSLPVLTAVDWEPMELSAVPVPADGGAHSRAEPGEAFECEIRMAPAGPTSAAADTAVRAERERNSTITELAANAHFDALGAEHVRKGTSVDSFRTIVIDAMIARENESPTNGVVRAVLGVEHGEKRAAVIELVLAHRMDATSPLPAGANEFRGMTLTELAREALAAGGVNTRGMSRDEVASRALSKRAGGLHGTSDFTVILGNAVNRTLRAAYDNAPQTFGPLVRRVTVPDFKPVTRAQLGEAPRLEKVNEAGEYKRGTIREAGEVYSIATFGKIVGITRQALVNDSLDALGSLPRKFGEQAAQIESDLVWAEILANPTMGDGTALFHSANHKNDATVPVLLSSPAAVAAITAGRVAMAKQYGLDGRTVLNIRPTHLIVPPSSATDAERITAKGVFAQTTDTIVVDAIRRLEIISENRLENGTVHPITGAALSGSTARWFLAAATSMGQECVELAHLDDMGAVTLEREVAFNTDGIEFKVRLDAAAKVIEWRGLYRNIGQ